MKRKWKKLLVGVCAAAMGLTMFSTAGIPAQSVQAEEAPSGREVLNFNSDWGFYRGDLENAQDPDFDDSEFASVTLPHTMQLAKKHCRERTAFIRASAGIGDILRWTSLMQIRRSSCSLRAS